MLRYMYDYLYFVNWCACIYVVYIMVCYWCTCTLWANFTKSESYEICSVRANMLNNHIMCKPWNWLIRSSKPFKAKHRYTGYSMTLLNMSIFQGPNGMNTLVLGAIFDVADYSGNIYDLFAMICKNNLKCFDMLNLC